MNPRRRRHQRIRRKSRLRFLGIDYGYSAGETVWVMHDGAVIRFVGSQAPYTSSDPHGHNIFFTDPADDPN